MEYIINETNQNIATIFKDDVEIGVFNIHQNKYPGLFTPSVELDEGLKEEVIEVLKSFIIEEDKKQNEGQSFADVQFSGVAYLDNGSFQLLIFID